MPAMTGPGAAAIRPQLFIAMRRGGSEHVQNHLAGLQRHFAGRRLCGLQGLCKQPAGHDRGADHWGIVASLIETCKLNAVDPQPYFASVLSRLVNGWPMRKIDDLMPWARAIRQDATAAA